MRLEKRQQPFDTTHFFPMSQNGGSLLDHPVGLLFTTRQLQDSPYEPLSNRRLNQALTTHHKYRPMAHVVQKLLVEFYSKMNGRYGIHVDDPSAIVSTAVTRSKRFREGAEAAQQAPVQPSLEFGSGVGDNSGVSTASGAGVADQEQLKQFRLQQLRRATAAAATASSSKPCQHYLSREGCRRGLQCPFSHVVHETVLHAPNASSIFHSYPHGPLHAPSELIVPR